MREQLIDMIKECKKAINNASQFGDTATIQAIQNQINVYEAKLAELEEQEINKQRLEAVIEVMISECKRVYASKDDNKINKWLNNNYKPFRLYWINRMGEDAFCEIWNKVNEATK